MYPHINQIFWLQDFTGKPQGNPALCTSLTDSAQLRTLPFSLDCPPVNHFTTVLWTSEFTQVSPFSSTVMKGHFSWHTFLNTWKHLLFTGDSSAGAWAIDSAMLSLAHKMFFKWCPDSENLFGLQLCRCNVLFGKHQKTSSALCLSHTCSTLLRSKSKSAYFCLSHTYNASQKWLW